MKMKIFFVLLVVLIMSLIPSAIRTYNSSLHAYDLIVLATTVDNKLSMNPYDGKGLLINQNIAVSILKNFQYPYQCSAEHIHGCDISLISWTGRSLPPDNVIASKRGLELIRFFAEKGESLEESNAGLPLVHEAILFNNPEYLKLLLSLGANVRSIARHEDKPYHELNPEAFLRLLESKEIMDYSEVRTVLEYYLSDTTNNI